MATAKSIIVAQMREAAIATLTADKLKSILTYNPISGDLRWKNGKIATQFRRTSAVVSLGCVIIIASRLIWYMQTGQWPERLIDHKDNDPHNNAWRNLRKATGSQNSINRDYATSMPYRGIRVINWGRASGQRWRARITIRPGKRIELGTFGSAEEAYEAYKRAAIKYHKEFARL